MRPFFHYVITRREARFIAAASGNGDTGTYSSGGITYGLAGALPNYANTAIGVNNGSVVSSRVLNFAQVTVAAWVKINAVPSASQLVAGFVNGIGNSMCTADLYVDSSGQIGWYLFDGTAHYVVGPALTVGQWYYVVGTADGTTSRLYVNGVAVSNGAAVGNSQTGFTVPNFLISGGSTLFGGNLDAVVDEVAVYDYALSGGFIATQYAAASGWPQIKCRYDVFNRLIEVSAWDGTVFAAYLYDAMNRRVRKTVTNGGSAGNIPNGTTDYIWQGWQTMEERNPFGGSGSTDTPTKQYIWGTYIDECIQLTTLVPLGAQNLAAGSYYLLQDLLFRAVALTNSGGYIVEAYDTDAYGNTLIFIEPGSDGRWFTDDDVQSTYGANEIIYCGYRFDPDTQLYYVRNRTYNPVLGRWIQRDPIGYAGGINLYEYVEGRATLATDPKGTECDVTFQCLLYRSQLPQDDTRVCSYICRELNRVTVLGGDSTDCSALPAPPLVMRFDKQHTSSLNWVTFGWCGSPSPCKKAELTTKKYSRLANLLPKCSRAKCRHDCGLAESIAKQACDFFEAKIAKKSCDVAAGASYTVCISSCDSFCKQP